jgi:hypothetical protein
MISCQNLARAYKDEKELERLASLQCLSYHVVHGEETTDVPTVKLPDNFAEHHDGQIIHWLLFDTELADGFSREFIAPEIGRPLERVEDSSGT